MHKWAPLWGLYIWKDYVHGPIVFKTSSCLDPDKVAKIDKQINPLKSK